MQHGTGAQTQHAHQGCCHTGLSIGMRQELALRLGRWSFLCPMFVGQWALPLGCRHGHLAKGGPAQQRDEDILLLLHAPSMI